MVKTECQRRVVKNNILPPENVLKELKRSDSALELIYNTDKNRWEIYRVKCKGVVPDEDILHWQMSSPETGTGIGVWIVNWLKQYDTSLNGLLSPDELRDSWLKQVRELEYKEFMQKEKQFENSCDSFKPLIDSLATDKKVFGPTRPKKFRLPVAVATHKKTHKRVYAFKKD